MSNLQDVETQAVELRDPSVSTFVGIDWYCRNLTPVDNEGARHYILFMSKHNGDKLNFVILQAYKEELQLMAGPTLHHSPGLAWRSHHL